MKYKSIYLTIMFICGLAISSMAAEGHGKHDQMSEENAVPGTFIHHAKVHDIRSEFQIMSLANMNIKSQEGDTHHIMVKFFMEGMAHPISDAIGKIKVIGPDKKEQIKSLENYNGVLVANFTFNKEGRYGVICLFKVNGKKEVIKFWYPHKV